MAESVADVPAMAAFWDADRNEAQASEMLAKSYKTSWWKCEKGHSFQRKPRMMSNDPACPTCALGQSSLFDTHSALAKYWHPSKNDTTASDVTAQHTASMWWVCDEGHAFERSPLSMVNDASCPHCALASDSLAARFPEIAAEWHPQRNGDVGPDQLEPFHKMTAHWVCSKGHEFSATVRSRTKSHGRCPQCYGAWSTENIRGFVQSLLGHIEVLTPGEMFALAMQAGALRGASSRAFVKALTTGRFPTAELEKFAEGKPSLVDEFAGDAEFTLELQDLQAERELNLSPDDPYALPARRDSEFDFDDGEVDVAASVPPPGEAAAIAELEEGDSLPVVQTRDALAALDSVFIANADAETVKFLLDSAVAKLWRHAYRSPDQAESQARQFTGDTYSTIVRDRFLSGFDAAESMTLPDGYAFRPTPQHDVCPPHLMQRHVAVSVAQKRRYG